LRAQLHGDVLPKQAKLSGALPEVEVLRQRIVAATPNFAPKDIE
jgi:hypothetical protein